MMSEKMMYPLATETWDGLEKQAIQEVVDSGNYTMGARVKAFEEAFAAWVGSKYALMANSGSSANLLAVAAQFYKKSNPWKAGDEVIVPAVSWSTTYFPLAQYGLKQVYVDIDPDTLNLDLKQVEAAITERTRGIFAVNLLGNPVDYEVLGRLIEGKDITLLEDNCESMGAEISGRKAGTFGVVGTHSTFFSHHMSTMEGGICQTDDEELYHIMLCLRAHGWLRNLPEKNHVFNKTGDAFRDSFCFALPGYCLRPTEMQGAIGSVQLAKLDRFIELRRAGAAEFQRRFGGRKDLKMQKETGKSSWFGFALTITPEAGYDRAELVKVLRAHGVECRPVVTGDFTQNPVFKHMNHKIFGELKAAPYLHTHGIMVGNNPMEMTGCFDVLEKALAEVGR